MPSTQFRISSVLWLVALLSVSLGWYLDHRQLTQKPAVLTPPTPADMRVLAGRIGRGETGAFEELVALAKELYRDIDYDQEEPRVMANLHLMSAASETLGEQAAKGDAESLQALKRGLGYPYLGSFAPGGLGVAAGGGCQEAIDILVNYEQWGMQHSDAVQALRTAGAKNNEQAVDFLIRTVTDGQLSAYECQYATKALAGAAAQGNEKAKAALEQYAARMHEPVPGAK